MGYGNVSVTTSATEILPENKRRTSFLIRNNGSGDVYWAFDNSVTTANGMPLKPGEFLNEKIATDKLSLEQTLYTGSIYGIAASAQDVRWNETDDVSNVRTV